MVPGEVYKLTIDAGVTSNVFLAGHRIRIEISSSNFPRFDRNPNTGRRDGGRKRIRTGPARPCSTIATGTLTSCCR